MNVMKRCSPFVVAFFLWTALSASQARTQQPVRLPPRSPNLNAHLERFFGSLKSECLHKLILFGETATRKAVRAFLVPIF